MASIDLAGQTPASGRLSGAILDMTLLFFTLAAASDALSYLTPLQGTTWLASYGLVLLRIVMTGPYFLAFFARHVLVMAYPLICIASMFWSYSPVGTLISALQLFMTVLMGCYLGWRYSLVVICKVFAIIMTVFAALSLFHLVTRAFPWPTHTEAGGLAGMYRHKNMLGLRSLFTITIVVGLMLVRRGEPGWTNPLLLWVALAINMVTLVLAQSGTALMLMPVMAGLVLLVCVRRVPRPIALVGLALVIGGISLGPLSLSLAGINPAQTALDALGKDATLTGRTLLWDIAMRVIVDHPHLGTGFRAFWIAPEFANGRVLTHDAGARTAASFHNFVLEVLASVGWPGLLAMLGAIALGVYRIIKLIMLDCRPSAAVALALMVGIFITALLTTSLFRGHEIMMFLMPLLVVAAGEDLRHAKAARLRDNG